MNTLPVIPAEAGIQKISNVILSGNEGSFQSFLEITRKIRSLPFRMTKLVTMDPRLRGDDSQLAQTIKKERPRWCVLLAGESDASDLIVSRSHTDNGTDDDWLPHRLDPLDNI